MDLFPPICFNLPFGGGRFCIVAKFQLVNNLTHIPVAFAFSILYWLIAMALAMWIVDLNATAVLTMSAAMGAIHGHGKELAEGTCGQGYDLLDLLFHFIGVALFVWLAYALDITRLALLVLAPVH